MSLYMETLNWVNERRRRSGLDPIPELLPGESGNGNRCTLAKSLIFGDPTQEVVVVPSWDNFGGEFATRTPGGGVPKWQSMPAAPNILARRFDDGYYPELEA